LLAEVCIYGEMNHMLAGLKLWYFNVGLFQSCNKYIYFVLE